MRSKESEFFFSYVDVSCCCGIALQLSKKVYLSSLSDLIDNQVSFLQLKS